MGPTPTAGAFTPQAWGGGAISADELKHGEEVSYYISQWPAAWQLLPMVIESESVPTKAPNRQDFSVLSDAVGRG